MKSTLATTLLLFLAFLSNVDLLFGFTRNFSSLLELSITSNRIHNKSDCRMVKAASTNDRQANGASPIEIAPLISLSAALWNHPIGAAGKSCQAEHEEIGKQVVMALQTSGFLLIESDLMPQELQKHALEDATTWLTAEKHIGADDGGKVSHSLSMVTRHPEDPKSYVMLEAKHTAVEQASSQLEPYLTQNLLRYWKACESLKKCVLRAIAVGLQLEHAEDLASWHTQGQHSAMRLLRYPPALPTTGNRCKAHSDYGSVTLLSTDGVSGLEILLDGTWWPVPHKPGTMVVNIGSLLSEWTTRRDAAQGVSSISPLLATLHRVAGPASENSASKPRVLQAAMSQGRTSIAFFADPDNGTPLSQKDTTIEDYIMFRSGGSDATRSGVAFTEMEKGIAEQKHE